MSIYVFGYGSLIEVKNIPQISQACIRQFWPVRVQGLARSLCVRHGSSRVFGVQSVPSAVCNGVLFEVVLAELEALAKREEYYFPALLDAKQLEFPYGDPGPLLRPQDSCVYFSPRNQYIVEEQTRSSDNYLERCKQAAFAISQSFYDEFLLTSGT